MTAVDRAARVPILEAIITECAYLYMTLTWDEKSLVWRRLNALTHPLLYLRRGEDLIVDNRLRQILNHARKRSA